MAEGGTFPRELGSRLRLAGQRIDGVSAQEAWMGRDRDITVQ